MDKRKQAKVRTSHARGRTVRKEERLTVVVPTIREASILRFLDEWAPIFKKQKTTVVVVEDNPTRTFSISPKRYPFTVLHFAWDSIAKDLGRDSWIIPRRTSAIKSYGFWKAYQLGADAIVSFDDDCYPLHRYGKSLKKFHTKNALEHHAANLFSNTHSEEAFVSSMSGIRPRGLPYEGVHRTIVPEQVLLSHGLWANVPDLDAKTQISHGPRTYDLRDYFQSRVIPRHAYFPMCGMNVAWKRELTPAMYFLLMGKNEKGVHWGHDRFDDIWAGIFVKKILDTLDYRAVSGHPVIWHDRASDPKVNLEKERTGLVENERVWKLVDSMRLKGSTVPELYRDLTGKLVLSGEYWTKLRKAMRIWVELFS